MDWRKDEKFANKNEVSLFLTEIIHVRYYLPLSVHTENAKCKYYHGLEKNV